MKNKHWITILSALAAVLFTVYIVLDTFVISHTYVVVSNSASYGAAASVTDVSDTSSVIQTSKDVPEQDGTTENISFTNENSKDQGTDAGAGIFTENSYTDENISIRIEEYRVLDTTIYVADVQVSDPSYLKTAFAQNAYGKNVTAATSDIAEGVNAILAINGDYYGVQETGYVIRQGVLYRETGKTGQQDLVIYADGSFEIIEENEVSAQELMEKGAYNVLSFGPGLIVDGEIAVSEGDEVDKARTSNPRTAIGIIDELHYVLITADGRTDASEGLSLYELAQFMQELGCVQAYNLDGGGSSTMVFDGEVVNNPTSGSKGRKSASAGSTSERSVSDIVYVGY